MKEMKEMKVYHVLITTNRIIYSMGFCVWIITIMKISNVGNVNQIVKLVLPHHAKLAMKDFI